MTSITRSYICGNPGATPQTNFRRCFQGGPDCNGYCHDNKVQAPKTYELELLDFGAALAAVKQGSKIAREGWNGKGMWVELQVPDAHSKMTLPYLYLNYPTDAKTTPGARVPWLASQTDILADDWTVVS